MKKIISLILPLILFFVLFFVSCQNAKQETVGKRKLEIITAFSKANQDIGIIALIEKEGKVNNYTAGYANLDKKTKINKDDLFEIGSASKIFTAIAIMQLVEKGDLSLDTTLNEIYPSGNITQLANYNGKNYWHKVTVKMLLNHTTGFIDYLETFGDEEKTFRALNFSTRNFSLEEIINMAIQAGDANFIPQEGFAYSNTNYIILGDIISKKSQMDWRDYIQKHIFKKLALTNTFFGSRMSAEQKSRMITGYANRQLAQMPYSMAQSAGEIISNTEDLRKFLLGWANGNLYQKTNTFKGQISLSANQTEEDSDDFIYTLGVMRISNKVVGHEGQTFGFQTIIGINEKTKDIYILGLNDSLITGIDDLYMKLIN